jgi:hypothetical protein
MTSKRWTRFQNPVNPVILSETQIETCQTRAAIKPSNATGWQPVESRNGLTRRVHVLQHHTGRDYDNVGRFPGDFMFQLTAEEFAALTSQIATSKPGRGRGCD